LFFFGSEYIDMVDRDFLILISIMKFQIFL
jgi:hypothetical protein